MELFATQNGIMQNLNTCRCLDYMYFLYLYQLKVELIDDRAISLFSYFY